MARTLHAMNVMNTTVSGVNGERTEILKHIGMETLMAGRGKHAVDATVDLSTVA